MATNKKPYQLRYEPCDRDLKIASMVAEGMSFKEIGGQLRLLECEVSYLVQKMRQYYGVKNSQHLVAYLLRNKMIS